MPIPGLESSIWVRAGPAGRTCAYGYGQSMCEKNAESEGVAARCRFQHGDANKLDFPDGSFDAVVSNYVYHNVIGADKRAPLRKTLRVLKRGGAFALNDDMKPQMYGNMEEFAQELRDMGYAEVRLIDTATEAFGSRYRAAMLMLGNSRMLVGRKETPRKNRAFKGRKTLSVPAVQFSPAGPGALHRCLDVRVCYG